MHKGQQIEEVPAAAAAAPAGEPQPHWQPANVRDFEATVGNAASGQRAEVADDDNTLELRAQLLGGLARGGGGGLAAAADVTDDLSRAAAAATSYHAVQPAPLHAAATRMATAGTAPTPASLAPPPSTLRATAPTPAQLPSSVPLLRPVEEVEYGETLLRQRLLGKQVF